MEYGKNPVLERIVTMEMAGMLEFWQMDDGGGIHLLLALPAHACSCREPHTWFVNRDGRTRCCDCDREYVHAQRRGTAISEVARLRGAA